MIDLKKLLIKLVQANDIIGQTSPDISYLNIIYPIGSYYETSLPITPTSGHSFENNNLTDEEIASCGINWFDPRVIWGGTWILEIAGMMHVSGGTGYAVAKANNANGAGAKDGGSKDAIIPYHNHTFTGNALGNHAHGPASGSYFVSASISGEGETYSGTLDGSGYKLAHIKSTGGFGWGATTGNKSAGTPSGTVKYAGTEGNRTNANMPPHINVYRWHRTA